MKKLVGILLLVMVICLSSLSIAQESLSEAIMEHHIQYPSAKSDPLEIHILKLEDGESTLIISPTGFVTLIDGGSIADGPKVVNYLRSKGVKKIDLLIAGCGEDEYYKGLNKVMQSSLPVYLIGINDSVVDRAFWAFAERKSREGVFMLVAGESYDIGGKAKLECVYEDGMGKEGYIGGTWGKGDKSACFTVTYKKFDYFTGSAVGPDIIEDLSGCLQDVDVMKLGGIGVLDQSNEDILENLKPEFAIAVYNDKHYDYFPDFGKTIALLEKHDAILINNSKPPMRSLDSDHETGLVMDKASIIIKVPKGKKYFINDLAVMKDEKAKNGNNPPVAKFTVAPGNGEGVMLFNPAGTKDSNGIQRVYWVVGDDNKTGMSVGLKPFNYKVMLPDNVTSREVNVKMFAFDKMGKGTCVLKKTALSKYKYKLNLTKSSYYVKPWSNFYVDVVLVDHNGRPVPNTFVKADAFFILWGTSDTGYTDSSGRVRMHLYANTGVLGESYRVNVKAEEKGKVVAKNSTFIKIKN